VGTGRCGSTAFHSLIARHPNTMWLSGFAEYFPDRPAWNRWAVSAVSNPLVRGIFGKRIKPGENYGFWYTHAYGFAEPGRDIVAADVLNEIFEDAKFIHIVRDGRAVASSLLHINEWQWRGWYGPYSWRYGPLSSEDQALWEASNRSFAVLAGLQWRIHTRAVEAARRALEPNRFLEVRYETFCEQPEETCRRVSEFAELPDSPAFNRHVKAASIKDMTNRWRTDLSPEQQAMLTEVLREDLLRYGYDISVKPRS
jgi:omega-hydroxy-beta-dihydromenaquinone-9 sulfotransferase